MNNQTKLIRQQAYSFELSAITVENAASEGIRMLAALRQDGEPNVIYQRNLWSADKVGQGTRLAQQLMPSIVLRAFACELYLKAVLSHEGKSNIFDHNLERLFLACSTDMQSAIRTKTCSNSISEMEFPQLLNDHAKIFQEFRYSHESSAPQKASIIFLQEIVKAIASILDDTID